MSEFDYDEPVDYRPAQDPGEPATLSSEGWYGSGAEVLSADEAAIAATPSGFDYR